MFLAAEALSTIRRDLSLPIDPTLLVGMATCLLIAPGFTRRWHLGGRVLALSRDAAASLRSRLRERIVATLQREKLWDRQHALPRPRDVTRVAVIHPAGAAGWGDIAVELGRWEAAGILRVRSHPAPFEGDLAAGAIVAALRAAVQVIDGYRPDLVLMVRGGGARASLAVLDEETVARAILGCPVPVICGTGHAHDRTTLLAGLVCWRSVDTPSKAIGLVADLIRNPARAAIADWDAILSMATTMAQAHASQLESRRQAMLAGFQRALTSADRQLVELWSGVQAEARASTERLKAAEGELDRHLAIVLLGAPQLLDAAEGMLQQLLQAGLGRAASLLGRMDDGAALLAHVQIRAGAVLERETSVLQRSCEAIEDAADRQLDREQVALGQLLALIEADDLGRMLARGLVVVTDAEGRLLPTRASAAERCRLWLHFGDGVLAVVPAG